AQYCGGAWECAYFAGCDCCVGEAARGSVGTGAGAYRMGAFPAPERRCRPPERLAKLTLARTPSDAPLWPSMAAGHPARAGVRADRAHVKMKGTALTPVG